MMAALREEHREPTTERRMVATSDWVAYRFDLGPLSETQPALLRKLREVYREVEVYRDHGKGGLPSADELRGLALRLERLWNAEVAENGGTQVLTTGPE